MDKKDLQLQTGQIIVDSKMTKPAKLQMLQFIQHEASESQLMALILDGRIVKLDEQAEEIVKDRFTTKIDEGDVKGAFALNKKKRYAARLGNLKEYITTLKKNKADKCTDKNPKKQDCIKRFDIFIAAGVKKLKKYEEKLSKLK